MARAGARLGVGIELTAAMESVGTQVDKCERVYTGHRECNCRPFDWIEDLYADRQRLGKRSTPLKVTLAALYGKFCQNIGLAPFQDLVAAGWATAHCRAAVLRAVGLDPEAVALIATDAIYATRELPLDTGIGLGQWKVKELPDLFVVNSGIF